MLRKDPIEEVDYLVNQLTEDSTLSKLMVESYLQTSSPQFLREVVKVLKARVNDQNNHLKVILGKNYMELLSCSELIRDLQQYLHGVQGSKDELFTFLSDLKTSLSNSQALTSQTSFSINQFDKSVFLNKCRKFHIELEQLLKNYQYEKALANWMLNIDSCKELTKQSNDDEVNAFLDELIYEFPRHLKRSVLNWLPIFLKASPLDLTIIQEAKGSLSCILSILEIIYHDKISNEKDRQELLLHIIQKSCSKNIVNLNMKLEEFVCFQTLLAISIDVTLDQDDSKIIKIRSKDFLAIKLRPDIQESIVKQIFIQNIDIVIQNSLKEDKEKFKQSFSYFQYNNPSEKILEKFSSDLLFRFYNTLLIGEDGKGASLLDIVKQVWETQLTNDIQNFHLNMNSAVVEYWKIYTEIYKKKTSQQSKVCFN